MRRVPSGVLGISLSLLLFSSLDALASQTPARSHATARALATTRCSHRNQPSGSLTVSDNFYTPSLNQFQPASSFETYPFLFDDLFRYDSRGRLFSMMASRLPTLRNGDIKAGGKTIVIHLKRGLRWSNGTEITSTDIKFGWQVGMDPGSGVYCAGSCDVIHAIDTPDRYTSVLHLSRLDPALLSPSLLIGGSMPPIWPRRWAPYWDGNVHAAAVDLTQDPTFTFIGPRFPTDGPYQATSQGGNRTVLRPMRYYDDMTCGAYLKTLVYKTYNVGATASSAGQIAAALGGEVDVGLEYFSHDIATLTRHSNAFHVHVEPTFGFEHMEFNLDRTYNGARNPLSDKKVRQALALALDKRRVVEQGLALPQKSASLITAWTPWVITPRLRQPYADSEITGQWDPLANGARGAFTSQTGVGSALADARKLLAGTPWKRGFTLDFYTSQNPERLTVMALVAAQWLKLGVTVKQHSVPAGQLLTSWEQGGLLDHGAYQVALFAEVGGPNPDPLALLMESRYVDRDKQVHNASLNQNYAGIRDKVIDGGFDRAISTYDRVARRQGFRAVQRELNQQAYWVPLYYAPSVSTSNGRIAGFRPSPGALETWNVYAWKRR
jgi:ABC-type transport system substrate-binding protein